MMMLMMKTGAGAGAGTVQVQDTWVNFVRSAVMQPMRLPTRKLAEKMPKKSRIAWQEMYSKLYQRAESREQRAEGRGQRAESREQRAEGREQRAESK